MMVVAAVAVAAKRKKKKWKNKMLNEKETNIEAQRWGKNIVHRHSGSPVGLSVLRIYVRTYVRYVCTYVRTIVLYILHIHCTSASMLYMENAQQTIVAHSYTCSFIFSALEFSVFHQIQALRENIYAQFSLAIRREIRWFTKSKRKLVNR